MSNTLDTTPFSIVSGPVDRTFQVSVTGSYTLQLDASHSVARPDWSGPGIGAGIKSAEGNVFFAHFLPVFDTATHTYTTTPVDLEANRDYTLSVSGGGSAGTTTISSIQLNAVSPVGATAATFTDSGFPTSYTYDGTWTTHTFTVPTTGLYVVTFNASLTYPDYISSTTSIGVGVFSSGFDPSPGQYWNLGVIKPRSASPLEYLSQSIRLTSGTVYKLTLGNDIGASKGRATIDTVQILQIGDSSAIASITQY